MNIHLALIGDGASTLPFDLNSIQYTDKNIFQSGSKDIFHISPLETIDVGEVRENFLISEICTKNFKLFHLQFWCENDEKLPYYCESVEVMNNFNEKKYLYVKIFNLKKIIFSQ